MKNLIKAQKRFNNMYERVSTITVPTAEIEIVRNYGRNMMIMYGPDKSLFSETRGQVRACQNLINQRNNEIL